MDFGRPAPAGPALSVSLTDRPLSLSARGVRVVREPATHAYGTVAVFEDLYGNLWDLVQFG